MVMRYGRDISRLSIRHFSVEAAPLRRTTGNRFHFAIAFAAFGAPYCLDKIRFTASRHTAERLRLTLRNAKAARQLKFPGRSSLAHGCCGGCNVSTAVWPLATPLGHVHLYPLADALIGSTSGNGRCCCAIGTRTRPVLALKRPTDVFRTAFRSKVDAATV